MSPGPGLKTGGREGGGGVGLEGHKEGHRREGVIYHGGK